MIHIVCFVVEESNWHKLISICQEIERYASLVDSMERTRLAKPSNSPIARMKRGATRPTRPTTLKPDFVPPGNKMGNLLITNGTIWCGTGNKATSYDELGKLSLLCPSRHIVRSYHGNGYPLITFKCL